VRYSPEITNSEGAEFGCGGGHVALASSLGYGLGALVALIFIASVFGRGSLRAMRPGRQDLRDLRSAMARIMLRKAAA